MHALSSRDAVLSLFGAGLVLSPKRAQAQDFQKAQEE